MGKKRASGMSKRIKTRHKKVSKSRKTASEPVNPAIRNLNQVITKKTQQAIAATPAPQMSTPQIQLQTVSVQTLKKLTGNPQRKQRIGKLSIDDGMYLQKLLKKWGTNYARMAQDIKLNRMQWTAQQIEKKHQVYLKMFPDQQSSLKKETKQNL